VEGTRARRWCLKTREAGTDEGVRSEDGAEARGGLGDAGARALQRGE
jgi:hypothetical protein